MTRKFFYEYSVPTLSKGVVTVSTAMHERLIVLVETDPSVKSYELDGPSWRHEGVTRKGVVSIPMTVQVDREEYWDAVDDRRGGSWKVEAKEAMSEALGRPYRLFDAAYFEANAVEFMNRFQLHRMLTSTRDCETTALERNMLMSLHKRGMRLDELAPALGTSVCGATVTAAKLWLRRLVSLPVVSMRLQPSWTVEAAR